MHASFGKKCKEYASRAVTGIVSLSVLAVTALTLSSPAVAAEIHQAPPGVPLVHNPVYHSDAGQKPDARLLSLDTPRAASVADAAPAYDVLSGDTLSGIAATHLGSATDWQGLCQANEIRDCNLIYVHEQIKLTAAVTTTSVPVAAQAPSMPSHSAAPVHHYTPPAPAAAPAPAPEVSYGGSPQADAQIVFGAQAGCADEIITRESGWNVHARNPYSGAYGLPQSLPAGKMASAGADWYSNPLTQLRWMLGYVNTTYGGACRAWSFWQVHHAY